MPLNPGDLMFVGWDSDNDDISFVTTTGIAEGEVIYFTDDEWNGTNFFGSEQLMEWTVPAGGVAPGTLVTIDMDRVDRSVTFDSGGAVDYLQGGYAIAGGNEMFWAYQGTRVGDDITPTNFIAVIGNEADGSDTQTPNLTGTGLTTSTGAIIIDGDEDYMEFASDGTLPDPVTQSALIAAISDTSNWTTADGAGNNNPNPGGGFDITFPTVVCFTSGSYVLTPEGNRLIETLQPGDLVQTRDNGLQQLRWVGKRRLSRLTLRNFPHLRPIKIATNAFGHGFPAQDMMVSPQHRILIADWRAELLYGEIEILAPAKSLLNDQTVTVDHTCAPVEYVHLLFDQHEIISVDGVFSESFFPSDVSLSMVDQAQIDELGAMFPDRLERTKTARPCLTVASARPLGLYRAP